MTITLLLALQMVAQLMSGVSSLRGDMDEAGRWAGWVAVADGLLGVLAMFQGRPVGAVLAAALVAYWTLVWWFWRRRGRRRRTLAELGAKSRARIEAMVRNIAPEGA